MKSAACADEQQMFKGSPRTGLVSVLVAAMLVPGIFLIRRYGIWAVIPGALIALPVVLLGGRSGDARGERTDDKCSYGATGNGRSPGW